MTFATPTNMNKKTFVKAKSAANRRLSIFRLTNNHSAFVLCSNLFNLPCRRNDNAGISASPKPLAVSTMKLPVLIILLLLLALFSSGQNKDDTTVTIKYIDSLKREIASLKSRNNFLYWSYQEKVNVAKIDTVFIRADSSIINFSLKDGRPLKRQFNILGKDNNLVQYTIHYYDNKGQKRYIENWDAMKEDYFDAKLSSAERIEYDSSGRQTLSLKYLQSVHRTIRTEYNYDLKGERQVKSVAIKGDAVWDE